MGDVDKPDALGSSEREQYLRYVEGKIARGEIPRTPDQWREVSAFFRTLYLHGRAVERGLDVVYDLPQKGFEAEVPYRDENGINIRVDRYLAAEKTVDGVAQNIEAKAGQFGKDRDLRQLAAYAEKLRDGEVVRYFTREARADRISPQARALMAKLQKEYPSQFIVMKANEKVFGRILEAGTRALEKEQQQKLQSNLEKIPAREADPLSVEQLAKDYLREIEKGQVLGQPVGIDQLRFMNEALRDMEAVQAKFDREQADRDRQALSLRFHESRDVERFLEAKAEDKHLERAEAIDKITHELNDRERAELGKATAEIAQQIAEAREQGKALDLDHLRQQHLALGNTLGAVQRMETDLFKDIAKGVPEQEAQSWLKAMEIIQADRDHPTAKAIDGLAETVEREEKARKEAAAGVEQAQRAAEQARKDAEQARITEQRRQEDLAKLPPHIANLLDVGQAQPPSAAVEHGPDGSTPRVQRGHGYGQERGRGLERGGR
ncbi:hypothetical protein [Nocardia gipuzkoensis]|uniref:hypothetical protein n=1 Tax=Nocardia gipuzkoensis TaxID=2749991 RepID=UPI00237D4B0C|nr:hypothetical protein [Nocardia gipuzkoensis]MDE1673842.1 hypothetical protein [Nocardia gipuzkoensis]